MQKVIPFYVTTWILEQRKANKKNKLSQERIDKLEQIGFIWDIKEMFWEEMFSKLLDYKNNYGNCNVPYQWPENYKLASWVSRQRNMKKKEKLSEERIQRLEAIGFVWNTKAND